MMNFNFPPNLRLFRAVIMLSLLASILFACSATKLTSSWVVEDHTEPRSYKNLAVVAMTPSEPMRAMIEVAVAERLREKNIQGIATFDIFPFLGKLDRVVPKDMDPDSLKHYIQLKMIENEIDGLLFISLFDTKQEEHYVSSGYYSPYVPGMAPVYGYSYHSYYAYAYSTIYDQGYYVNTKSYFLESNLYEVKDEHLVWSGHTKTKNPQNGDYEAANFASIIVGEMLNKKVIKP